MDFEKFKRPTEQELRWLKEDMWIDSQEPIPEAVREEIEKILETDGVF